MILTARPVPQEDALQYLVSALKKGRTPNYGYDLYIRDVIHQYVLTEERTNRGNEPVDLRVKEISPSFLAAAWELARRGVIRPGVSSLGAQSTDEGGAGSGYSVTPFGRQWLAESNDSFVPTEPERFGRLLEPYKERFGQGFHQRAQEAIRCYGAHAYLACCVMCGAAAESVLLALATRKAGEEPQVLQTYRAANGRTKIENLILGKARLSVQTTFRGLTDVMKYWRDESAHGTTSAISDVEALTSASLLLRLAQYASEQWDELTRSDA